MESCCDPELDDDGGSFYDGGSYDVETTHALSLPSPPSSRRPHVPVVPVVPVVPDVLINPVDPINPVYSIATVITIGSLATVNKQGRSVPGRPWCLLFVGLGG